MTKLDCSEVSDSSVEPATSPFKMRLSEWRRTSGSYNLSILPETDEGRAFLEYVESVFGTSRNLTSFILLDHEVGCDPEGKKSFLSKRAQDVLDVFNDPEFQQSMLDLRRAEESVVEARSRVFDVWEGKGGVLYA